MKNKIYNTLIKACNKNPKTHFNTQGVNIQNRDKQEMWLACTDTFRLHACLYDLVSHKAYQLPNGTYHPTNLMHFKEVYPNYWKLYNEAKTFKKVKKSELKDTIKPKYLQEALVFLKTTTSEPLEIYMAKEIYKPVLLCNKENTAFALIMRLRK